MQFFGEDCQQRLPKMDGVEREILLFELEKQLNFATFFRRFSEKFIEKKQFRERIQREEYVINNHLVRPRAPFSLTSVAK